MHESTKKAARRSARTLAGTHDNAHRKDTRQMRGCTPLHQAKWQRSGPRLPLLMWNSLHQAPFGLLEDVYVDESVRGSGLGTEIVNAVVAEAKDRGCYKL